jgi:hypothetical protein
VVLSFAEAMVMMASATKCGSVSGGMVVAVKEKRKEERKTNGNKGTEQLSVHSYYEQIHSCSLRRVVDCHMASFV